MKLREMTEGTVFNAGPVDVVVLEHFVNGQTLLAANAPIGERPFTVRPFVYNRRNPEPPLNNFAFSSLCYDLNGDFLVDLDDAGVIPESAIPQARWDLSDSSGDRRYGYATCQIAMLPESLAKKYHSAGLLKVDEPEWTITPCVVADNIVSTLWADGEFDDDPAYICNNVRPAFFVDSELNIHIPELNAPRSSMLAGFTDEQIRDEAIRRFIKQSNRGVEGAENEG